MYQKLLRDKRFFAFLFQCDQDLAREAQREGCPFCGGPLHQAHFARKPRGGAIEIGSPEALRLSFCCGRDGCRKRLTPASLRFLGRRVYLAVDLPRFRGDLMTFDPDVFLKSGSEGRYSL